MVDGRCGPSMYPTRLPLLYLSFGVCGRTDVGGRRSVFVSFFCFSSAFVYRMHVLCSWRRRSQVVIICRRSCMRGGIVVGVQDSAFQFGCSGVRSSSFGQRKSKYVHIREIPCVSHVCFTLTAVRRLLFVNNYCCSLSCIIVCID